MNSNQNEDFNMLIACNTIAENFASNINELRKINHAWTDKFVNKLLMQVEEAFAYYLDLEANRKIQDMQNKLNSIQIQALRAICFLKTRIDITYANDEARKNYVLDQLGFKLYLQAVEQKDAEALIELLSKIRKNLSDDITKELIKNHSDQTFIERISLFAAKLKKINRSHNALVATKKLTTKGAVGIFSDLYLDILTISKQIKDFYKNQPEKAKMFDYNYIVKHRVSSAVKTN